MLVLDSRALRARAVAKATTALASGRVDRPGFEAELNACWRSEAAATEVRREEAIQERHARERVWAEQRAQHAAQEAARQALACTVCGKPETAGLCSRCRDERRVEEPIAEAVDVAVVTWGMGGGQYRLDAGRRTTRDMRQAVEQAVAELLTAGDGVFAESVALAARLAAELQLGSLQRRAVNRFAYQPPAQAEYEKVFATEMRRSHLHDNLDEAREAVEDAGRTARFNTARALLHDRLRTLRAARPTAKVDAEPDWYTEAAAQVRDLIRPTPPERAVSVRRPPTSSGSPTGSRGCWRGWEQELFRTRHAHRPVLRSSLTEWVEGLSGWERRLLLEDNTELQYVDRTTRDFGYRMTMALAVAVSQPTASGPRAVVGSPGTAPDSERSLSTIAVLSIPAALLLRPCPGSGRSQR
ncbi:hypothetical protein AB0P17_24345 [Streptomyces sp. NPDC088124]|uniref:hypothetical protein n=1 Tax=Streptomyces sp. NPDC088124 TaxID=3154654 RepID=UPI0034262F17